MTRTWSVFGTSGGRVFIEAENSLPSLRLCVVSDSNPPSVAWIGFAQEDVDALRSVLETAIHAMGERV